MGEFVVRREREGGGDRKLGRLRVANPPETVRLRFGAVLVAAIVSLAVSWCGAAWAAEPRVVLVRGWFGVFSTGLDSLADELKAKGIKAELSGHLQWSAVVSNIVRERAAGSTPPLVFVGHSQGANNVIDMARSLGTHNIPVDLLVTLAPFLQSPVPSNVMRAINYYQSPGWGAPLIPDRGFRGKIVNNDVANDWTILHVSIDKSAKIHGEVMREIEALSQAR